MTHSDMVNGVRELLHDTGRGFATDDRFYQTEEIVRRLNEAKERVAKMLITSPKPASIATNRMAKTFSFSGHESAPDDFWRLMGGTRADGTWVPSAPASVAKPLNDAGHDYCYVLGGPSGNVYGPATTLAYWASPSEQIQADSGAALTEFSDSVYYVIQLLAARELLPQEKADAVDRHQLITKMLSEEMPSFS